MITCKRCGAATDDKPYCIEHLDRIGYVAGLQDDMATLEHESSGSIPIDPNGIGCRDVLLLVAEHGVLSIGRISQLMKLDMSRHVRALERARKVSIVKLPYRESWLVRRR